VKFYKRNPHTALAGMSALNPGQRGIYNSIIDLLYSCDGLVPCMTPADDYAIAKNISVAPQTWRKFKRELLGLGKIRVTTDGLLDANGVKETRNLVETYSDTQRKRVSIRWHNYRLAKQFNGGTIQAGNTKDSHSKSKSSTNLESEEKGAGEENGDNEPVAVEQSTSKSIATGELDDLVRAKGWR
jgi:hypothetical protein